MTDAKLLQFERCTNCGQTAIGDRCGHCGSSLKAETVTSADPVQRMVVAKETDELRERIRKLESEMDLLKKENNSLKKEKLALKSIIEAGAQDLLTIRKNLLNLQVAGE